MVELITEALVLDKEDLGDRDARVFLFTKELGKITAKIISAKKITSKLNGHLEPLNFAKIRLTNKNAMLITDALKSDTSLPKNPGELPHLIRALGLIKEIFPENQPDEELWEFLTNPALNFHPASLSKEILKISGFDPMFASCKDCHRPQPEKFLYFNASYICNRCFDLSQIDENHFVVYY